MTSVLGVDGGQSAIRLRHSADQRVVAVDGVSRLEGDPIEAVADAISRAWRDAEFDHADRVVMGLTTSPDGPEAAARLCALVGSAIGATEVWLTDDAVTAHAGALSLGWGISLVVGTGVACLTLPERGSARIIGGHGFLLGDEGGGFWIGRAGLRAVLRSSEGRAEPTSLTAHAEAQFGTLSDLPVRLHAAARPVNSIAQFAPIVLAEADGGDGVANAIVEEGVAELLLVVEAGAAGMTSASRPVPLALGGRLLAPDAPLRRRLDAGLGDARVRFDARTADRSPLEGAIELGLADGPGRYGGLIHRWTAREAA